jgi:DNA-binding FadR family transcriptional regulator
MPSDAVTARPGAPYGGAESPMSGVPMWRPVRGGNAFEITVSRLAQAIRLGLVAEGDRLPAERELAEKLQVSRVTLREAIRALREAGFLESRRGRAGGTFVVSQAGTAGRAPGLLPGGPGAAAVPAAGSRPPSASVGSRRRRGGSESTVAASVRPDGAAADLARQMGDSLHDALDFRRVLEPGAAGLAASRSLSATDRQHLVACLAASRDRESATRRLADSRLHLAIAAASGCPSLAAAVADVQLTLDRLLAAIPVIRRNLDHSDVQHARVVDAILAGDTATARAAMEEHCDGTAELLRGLLG